MSTTYRYRKVATERPRPIGQRYRRWKCNICGTEMNGGGGGLRMHFEQHEKEGKVRSSMTWGGSWSTVITFQPIGG